MTLARSLSPLRARKCESCRASFLQSRMGQQVCGPKCAYELVQANKAKVERKADRVKRDAMKSKGDLIAEAQVAFNAYIRLRDHLAGHNCISSGLPLDWSGNSVDAGHYRSRGSASHLRFNEDNVHAQSKQENRYKSGNAVDYRIGLIARIGIERIEALEADQEPRRYTPDELIAIKKLYQLKLKQLKGN